MKIDAYKEEFDHIEFFDKPALFTNGRISRFTVPEGWFCYDLRGSDSDPGQPYMVENAVYVNHAGSVLMPTDLKLDKLKNGQKKIGDNINFLGEELTLEEFCQEHGLEYPADTRRFIPSPASVSDAGLFYSQPPERENLLGTIGHLRMDFGKHGDGFWTTWFPHGHEELNTPEFKAEIDDVVNELRLSVLKDRASMRSFCSDFGGEIGVNYGIKQFGYAIETDHYRYCLRCKPMEGDYDGYLYCFDKRAQELGKASLGYLSDTTDYTVLLLNLSLKELQLAEEVVSDYYNGKYEVDIPRVEQADPDGYRQIDFDQPFPLTAHDDKYCDPHANALAITAFKWLEGFEDTGTFMEIVHLYADELTNKWNSNQNVSETRLSDDHSEGEMQFG